MGAGQHHRGGCHCGNLSLEFVSTQAAAQYQPRECDCSFCRKHDAAWVSDPSGRLLVRVREPDAVARYRQGSGTAELWICRHCGVLSFVSFAENGNTYAAVNVKALDDRDDFGPAVAVSPQRLDATRKVARWKDLWIADVSVEIPE